MARPKTVVYWDAMVWIAWLKNERHWPANVLDGMEECAKKCKAGEIAIVCGEALFRAEILQLQSLPTDAAKRLQSVLQGRRAQLLDYDPRIADLRAEIREYYAARTGEKVPSLSDAEHLAYAIHWGVDEFWTMDDGKHGGRSLLRLDGNVAGYPLRVCLPHAEQSTIFGLLP